MEKVIIYVNPNYDFELLDEFEELSVNEKLEVAEKEEDMSVYSSVEDFAQDFNNEKISDLGMMYIVEV